MIASLPPARQGCSNRNVPNTRNIAPARRGVAMMLVLISLMMATILATAYLSSRDNSSAIGDNVASAAAARWAAESGVEMGIAVLQTGAAWRTSHVGGRLVSNYALAGGTVDIDLVDIETGLAPSANTDYVRLTSTGTIDGVDQVAVAECHVPLTTGKELDLDLSEFAVFASQRLNMVDRATVARWPMAPLASMGKRVQVGTQATSASSIAIAGDAASLDTTVYHGPGASAMLIAVASSDPPVNEEFLDQIPLPASPSSGVAAPPAISTAANLVQSSGSAVTNASTRWKNVTLSNSAVRMLRGNITAVTDEDLSIASGAKLIIDGQVKLAVFGNAVLNGGSVELKAGARLTMFVRGRTDTAFDVTDGYIGELRSTATRDASGKATYMNPERVLIFSSPGGPAAPKWAMRNNSVIKGSIYAPDATLATIGGTSALYGRIATKDIAFRDDAALFYDPALDSGAGYTNPQSGVWDETSRLKTEVKTITSLDASVLQAVANTVGKVVLAVSETDPDYQPTTTTSTTPVVVGPTDPTPRPVTIEARYMTFGSSLDSWE